MPDLLSDDQHAEIRSALQDVFDTFSDTPVTFYQKGELVNDFMEDLEEDTSDDVEILVNGIVEYPTNEGDKAKIFTEGAVQNAQVKATFSLDDFDAAGLIENNIPKLVAEEDYMKINGERFEIVLAIADGPFEQKNVTVVVYGKREENSA